MHYARTTRLWHDRLLANRAAAEREVGAMKTRLWLMYLAGVSIGFDRARVGVFQTLASKRKRGVSSVPLSRADLYGSRVLSGRNVSDGSYAARPARSL